MLDELVEIVDVLDADAERSHTIFRPDARKGIASVVGVVLIVDVAIRCEDDVPAAANMSQNVASVHHIFPNLVLDKEFSSIRIRHYCIRRRAKAMDAADVLVSKLSGEAHGGGPGKTAEVGL